MKAVITVVGHDMVGILAKVSSMCAQKNANVIEVTQSVMQDLFAMIMQSLIALILRKFISYSTSSQSKIFKQQI